MFGKELKGFEKKGLLRDAITRMSPQGPVITLGEREYINFASNDYLGLAAHPRIIRAAGKAVREFGFGSGASRLLAGGSMPHRELEELVAEFKGVESAVIMNSGYSANTGIIPSITSEGDFIFSDELNHASIIDGCRLSRAKTVVYRHKDVRHLAGLIRRRNVRGKKIVITDSVFSMDGDIAPLGDIAEVCKQEDAVLYVDDAHATGVLGNGRGGLAHFGIEPEPWIIQMGTFSKSLGSFGAFAAGAGDIMKWIVNRARSFIFSTALPACAASASAAALRLICADSLLIRKLWSNRDRLAAGISDAGYDIMGSETPIIPIRTGSMVKTRRLAAFLFERGIYAPAIRPPTVKEPRIRVTVCAGHSEMQIKYFLRTLREFRQKTRS